MDIKIKNAGFHDQLITDHVSFNLLYHQLTKLINDTAVKVFGQIKRKCRNTPKIITNPEIEQLQARSRSLGGALRLDKNPTYSATHAAKLIHSLLSIELSLPSSTHLTLCSLLLAKRKLVNKDLYQEQSNEVYKCAKNYDAFRISSALAGGSTKCLVHAAEFVLLPLSINTTDGTGKLLSSPDQVKDETHHYWEKLYAHQPIP
jgi:hypothetical protein